MRKQYPMNYSGTIFSQYLNDFLMKSPILYNGTYKDKMACMLKIQNNM